LPERRDAVRRWVDVALALTPRDPSQSLDLPPGDEIVTIEIQESSE
jgi:hypothetical protein